MAAGEVEAVVVEKRTDVVVVEDATDAVDVAVVISVKV